MKLVPATAALMLVGLAEGSTHREAPAMAGEDRMAIEEVVRKVLLDEQADVLRESVKWLAAQLME